MTKKEFKEKWFKTLIKQRDKIVAGDHSYIDDLYEDKYWCVEDVSDLLAMYQLAQDQVPDEDICLKYNSLYDHFFSMLKEGIVNGKITTNKAMEKERWPSKPKFMPIFSLRYNLSQYVFYWDKRLDMLKPNNRLRVQFIMPDEALRYANEMGIPLPQKFLDNLCKRESTNPGAYARWEEQRKPLVDRATDFMLELIDIDCTCNHEKLSNITFELAKDENGIPLKNLEQKGMGLKTAIKRKAKSLVPAERRFGTDTYNPKVCKCTILDHQNFKLLRHRD